MGINIELPNVIIRGMDPMAKTVIPVGFWEDKFKTHPSFLVEARYYFFKDTRKIFFKIDENPI